MESKTQDSDDFCIINATRPPTPQHTVELPTFLSQLRSNSPPSPEPITRHVQREQQDAYRSYLEAMRKKTASMGVPKPIKSSIKFQDDEDLSSIPPPEPLISNSSIVSMANAFGVRPSMASVLSTPVVSQYVKGDTLISGVLTLPKHSTDDGTYLLQSTSNTLTLVPSSVTPPVIPYFSFISEAGTAQIGVYAGMGTNALTRWGTPNLLRQQLITYNGVDGCTIGVAGTYEVSFSIAQLFLTNSFPTGVVSFNLWLNDAVYAPVFCDTFSNTAICTVRFNAILTLIAGDLLQVSFVNAQSNAAIPNNLQFSVKLISF